MKESVAPDCTHKLALSMHGFVKAKRFISAYVLVLRHRNHVFIFVVVTLIVVSVPVIVVYVPGIAMACVTTGKYNKERKRISRE